MVPATIALLILTAVSFSDLGKSIQKGETWRIALASLGLPGFIFIASLILKRFFRQNSHNQ